MMIAPKGFGSFAGGLLVGNFGNGRIHAFDANTGDLLGGFRDANKKLVVIDALWSLFSGPDDNTIMFSAEPDDGSHGLIGQIKR